MSNIKIVFGFIIAVVLTWGTMFLVMPEHGVVVYDCRLAEISPDYPIEVKQECRKKVSGRI